jgi:regulator of sigma E protease
VLTGIISAAIGLGLMVLLHEWGHFVVARFFGVRVDVFSIGFGPRLFGVRRGPTDYRVSALPLGGYVRMAGDNPAEERRGDPDEFLSKPRWQRALIALAGPTTNLLLAVVLTAGIFVRGGQQPVYADQPAQVVGVVKGSPAETAGIKAGDRIVAFAGIKNPDWDRLELELALSAPGHMQAVTIDRGGQLVYTRVAADPNPFLSTGYPAEPTIVGTVTRGLPAEGAGLMPGDTIATAGGQAIDSPLELSAAIQENKGNALDLGIIRDGENKKITLHPSYGDPGDGNPRWQIGIGFRPASTSKSYSVPQAIEKAGETHLILAGKMLYTVGDLFTGRVSLKQVEGPIGIVQESSRAAKQGFANLVNLMALVSLSLAVLNLLPIPILDGGHITMLAIEGLLRRDLSLKIKERVVAAGMVFLLVVFALVVYNDVLRLLPTR